MEQQAPSPSKINQGRIRAKGRKSPNGQFFPSLIFFWGGLGGRIDFQSLLPEIAAWLNSICTSGRGMDFALHCGVSCLIFFAETAKRVFRLC